MRTKNYIEFINEISSDLLKRASDKAKSNGQKNLSKKFSDYVSPITMINDFKSVKISKDSKLDYKVMSSYTYDIYVDSYNLEGDDTPLNKTVKTKIVDYDLWEDDHFVFFLNFDIDHEEETSILSKIDVYGMNDENGYIDPIEFYYGEKFANKKSALKFIEMMKKLYTIHNPNIVNKALGKINDVDVTPVIGYGFYKFINYNYGSLDEFIKSINIRRLYDTY